MRIFCLVLVFSLTLGEKFNAPSSVRFSLGEVRSLRLATSTHNLAGCPKLAENCNFDCLVIGRSGCIECTCNKANGQGASLTSAHSSMNNNGCPTFPTNCGTNCASLDSYGCPVCKCLNGTSGWSISTSTTHQSSGGTSLNANGCLTFKPQCAQQCVTLDSNGCPVCECSTSTNDSSLIHGTYSSGNNLNSCPTFSTNCPAKCTTINDKGCPVCTCTFDKTQCLPMTSYCDAACIITDKIGCVHCNRDCTGSTDNVTCPTFDVTHCETRCLHLELNGCISCNCPGVIANTTENTPAPTLPSGGDLTTFSPNLNGVVTSSGSSASGTGCEVFDINCNPTCVTLDSRGCLMCKCGTSVQQHIVNSTQNPLVPGSYMTTSAPHLVGEVTGTKGSSNANGCPVFDVTCPAGCAVLDAAGCLSCSCANTNMSKTSTNITEHTGCQRVDVISCPPACLSVDSQGCILCSCSASSTTILPFTRTRAATIETRTTITKQTTTPLMTQTCPRFDDSCPHKCISIDNQGCLQCRCTAQSNTPNPTKSASTTTISSTLAPTTSPTRSSSATTCPPIRCVYPCNVGVTLGSDNCPMCKCTSS